MKIVKRVDNWLERWAVWLLIAFAVAFGFFQIWDGFAVCGFGASVVLLLRIHEAVTTQEHDIIITNGPHGVRVGDSFSSITTQNGKVYRDGYVVSEIISKTSFRIKPMRTESGYDDFDGV